MRSRYLIFGNGFIAEHYAKRLLLRGESLQIVFHSRKNSRLPSSLQYNVGDDIVAMEKMLEKYRPHYIILTQGVSFIPDNEKELKRSVESNVFSPLVVLEASYRLKNRGKLNSLKKILTFGSAAEYGGNHTQRWTEDLHNTKPDSFYGLVKHWLFDTSRFYLQSGLPCVHLRHFNAIGAGQDPRFVLSSFCKQIALMEREKIPKTMTVGDVTQKRDFIDVRDAMDAYDLILKRAQPGQVVNICSGKAHSVKKIIEILKKNSEVKFKTSVNPHLIAHKRTRNKIQAGTPAWLLKNGWRPKHTLENSIGWVLEYWRNEVKK